MTTATKRTCRTCPMVIPDIPGTDQCRPCQQRSQAVHEAVRAEPPPMLTPRKPKRPNCQRDGHHACEHYAALLTFLANWADELTMCPVCAAEIPQHALEDAQIQHRDDCALAVLISEWQP